MGEEAGWAQWVGAGGTMTPVLTQQQWGGDALTGFLFPLGPPLLSCSESLSVSDMAGLLLFCF